jgi:hypothetical protein
MAQDDSTAAPNGTQKIQKHLHSWYGPDWAVFRRRSIENCPHFANTYVISFLSTLIGHQSLKQEKP